MILKIETIADVDNVVAAIRHLSKGKSKDARALFSMLSYDIIVRQNLIAEMNGTLSTDEVAA
jgi:hypothetical protein